MIGSDSSSVAAVELRICAMIEMSNFAATEAMILHSNGPLLPANLEIFEINVLVPVSERT